MTKIVDKLCNQNKKLMLLETKYPDVFIDVNTFRLSYKVIQIIDNKKKVRRRVIGRPIKKSTKGNPKCDNYGNQLYARFKDFNDIKQHAFNYVDNCLDVNKFK